MTGVSSVSKTELPRPNGADDVIDYNRENFADGRTDTMLFSISPAIARFQSSGGR